MLSEEKRNGLRTVTTPRSSGQVEELFHTLLKHANSIFLLQFSQVRSFSKPSLLLCRLSGVSQQLQRIRQCRPCPTPNIRLLNPNFILNTCKGAGLSYVTIIGCHRMEHVSPPPYRKKLRIPHLDIRTGDVALDPWLDKEHWTLLHVLRTWPFEEQHFQQYHLRCSGCMPPVTASRLVANLNIFKRVLPADRRESSQGLSAVNPMTP